MKKKIFKNTILIILLLVVLCGVSIIGVLYSYFNKQYVSSLNQAAGYIAEGVNLSGLDFLTDLNENEKRITWVAADGTVLYDNKADPHTMENHKNRTEIKQAMTSSAGTSVRYSKTLSEETIYHAIRIADGSVVRVSVVRKSVPALLMKVLLPIILVLLLGVEFSAILAYRLSKQITTPLEAIDLDHPDESTVYDELSPFIRKIRIQNEQIQKAMTQLQTQKNEFALITENMQEGFLVVDKKEIVLSHNRSISTLFDVDESVDGKHVLEINRSEEFIDCIKKAIQGIHSEYICPVKGRFYNIYANPVFRNNEVAGAVVIITDVTEKEERENLRREFSANVSHELKTPLTSISGIAEIIKHGVLADKDYFEELERDMEKLRALDPETVAEVVGRSCEIKAGVVSRDEKEKGERAKLNLGHTFGHAIEKLTGYSTWLHGEAVAAGCVMAAMLSEELGYLSEEDVARVKALFEAAGLPTCISGLSMDAAMKAMASDKKSVAGVIRFVLMKEIGESFIGEAPRDKVENVMSRSGWY